MTTSNVQHAQAACNDEKIRELALNIQRELNEIRSTFESRIGIVALMAHELKKLSGHKGRG